MKKLALILIPVFLLLIAIGLKKSSPEETPSPFSGKTFRATPVKDQGKTQACWIYAYLACVETERIEHYGDSIDLSPLWLIYHTLNEQTQALYLKKGRGEISLRGIGPQAEQLMMRYGMVPEGHFRLSDGINSSVTIRNLTQQVKVAVRAQKGLSVLNDDVSNTLPRLPHNLEHGFYFYGMHYTPQQFANSLTYNLHFRWLTSYTHHPFNEDYILEVPDNRSHHSVHNIPIDSLLALTINSLKQRHPVYWEGQMGKPALSQKGESAQSLRQQAFERFLATDQHAMAIIGLTHDNNGSPLFICKNSWGKEWGSGGLCTMTMQQFLINTILVGIIDDTVTLPHN